MRRLRWTTYVVRRSLATTATPVSSKPSPLPHSPLEPTPITATPAAAAAPAAKSTSPPRKRHYLRTALILTVSAVVGGGLVTVFDVRPSTIYDNVFPVRASDQKRRVVIVGSGWGAVSILQSLPPGAFDVTVVSPRNYFLFTPLLPSTTVGTVESRSVMESIRRICIRLNATYAEAKATALDTANKVLSVRDRYGRNITLPYDDIVIAVGAKNNTFGVDGVEKTCFFLKEVSHARAIRHKVLDLFEHAALPSISDSDRKRLLSFVIVGGGPTGVEAAAELDDFISEDVSELYPKLKQFVSVSLIQSGDHILNTYDAKISEYAERLFAESNIHVITNARVLRVDDSAVYYANKKPQTATHTTEPPLPLTAAISHSPSNDVSPHHLVSSPAPQLHDKPLPMTASLSPAEAGAHSGTASTASSDVSGGHFPSTKGDDNHSPIERGNPMAPSPPIMAVGDGHTRIEFGMCIWSTGIDIIKFTQSVLEQFPSVQKNKKALVTDSQLRLLVDKNGAVADGVYAIGDCATVQLPVLNENEEELRARFKSMDLNHNEHIDMDELFELTHRITKDNPLLKTYYDDTRLQILYNRYASNPTVGLSQQEFASLARMVDSSAKALPATAQVAAQQGEYVARRLAGEQRIRMKQFNPFGNPERPFAYRHFGNLAYVGHDQAAFDFGSGSVFEGVSAFWLWKSVYLSKVVSNRQRVSLAFDWFKSFFFGRDTSKS